MTNQISPGSTFLYTPPQAARFIARSEGWLAKLRMTGGEPLFLKLGQSIRYDHADLLVWLEANRRASTSEYDTNSYQKAHAKRRKNAADRRGAASA
jgi:hypothetical protein